MTEPAARRHSTCEMRAFELKHVLGPDLDARRYDLNALCLSGGGIRSASFCLGVLQALAKAKLLREFDYLSTVSGGGYIGGWLQQLIREKNPHDPKATAEDRVARAEEELTNPASPALRRLREHTNFLTPQTGIGSADTWAGIALYLRNLGLNWLVLLPVFLLAALASISHRTVIWFLGQLENPIWAVSVLVLASLALAVAVHGACTWLPSHRSPDMDKDMASHTYWRWAVIVCALFWAGSVPVALQYLMHHGARQFACLGVSRCDWTWFGEGLTAAGLWGLPAVFFLVMVAGYLAAGFWQPKAARQGTRAEEARQLYCKNFGRWIIASLGSSALLLILLAILRAARDWLLHFNAIADTLTLAGPVVLLFVLLSHTTFYLGIRKRALRADLDREWLARLNGITVGLGVAWALFATACLMLPTLMDWINRDMGGTSGVGTTLLGAGAGASGLAASWLGRVATLQVRPVAQADAAGQGRIAQIAMRMLPLIFIVALFGFLGTVLQYVLGLAQIEVRDLLWPNAVLPPQLSVAPLAYTWGLLTEPCRSEPLAFVRDFQQLIAPYVEAEKTLPIILQAMVASLLVVIIYTLKGFINVNRFSMHAVYRNRLARAFLGTPRARREPDSFTRFDEADDPHLVEFAAPGGQGQRLYPVINVALNVTNGGPDSWAERKAMSFTATPLFCGARQLDFRHNGPKGAFVPTGWFARTNDPIHQKAQPRQSGLGQEQRHGTRYASMMTVSGAAASPHMGYHSSTVLAFLMTLFNVRLGAWYPNPAQASAQEIKSDHPITRAKPPNSLGALLNELLGQARADAPAIYLSDGGHFENLGIYEMIHRHCKRIVVIDAACDEECHYFDLGMAIRKAEIDFPVRIKLRTPWIAARADAEKDATRAATLRGIAYGSIVYLDERGDAVSCGEIIYIKPSWLPGAPQAVLAYAAGSPAFPHEGTEDQWFSESQFESYRALGEYQMSWLLKRISFLDTKNPTLAELFDRTKTMLAST